MKDEYVAFDELKHNTDEVCETVTIYQFQSIKNENKCKIQEVGYFPNVFDTLINKFEYNDKKCMLLGCLYNLDILVKNQTSCTFPMFKLIVNGKKRNICCITYNFHTFDHMKNKNIDKYINDTTMNNEIMALTGFYSMKLHYCIDGNDLCKYLDKYQESMKPDVIFETMIEYLTNEEINKLLVE